jgi:hypothetical protein
LKVHGVSPSTLHVSDKSWFQAFGFKFNLHRYTVVAMTAVEEPKMKRGGRVCGRPRSAQGGSRRRSTRI